MKKKEGVGAYRSTGSKKGASGKIVWEPLVYTEMAGREDCAVVVKCGAE